MNQLVFKFPFKMKYYEQDFYVSNNNFSAYATLGFTKATLQRDEPSFSYSSSATDSGATIGLGFTYHVNNNIDLDLKYHTTDINYAVQGSSTELETSIDALKLSAAYKF